MAGASQTRPPGFISLAEAAKRMGISKQTLLRDLARYRDLYPRSYQRRPGAAWRVHEDDVAERLRTAREAKR